MGGPREDAAAALLQNGKVLVTGGYTAPRAAKQRRALRPASGAWSPAAPMTDPRYSLARHPRRRPRARGRWASTRSPNWQRRIYDPATTVAGRRGLHAHDAAQVPLADGTVLASGNSNGRIAPELSCYEPEANVVGGRGRSPPRHEAAAALLPPTAAS